MSFMNSSTILVAMLLPRKRVLGSEVTETSCSISLFINCSNCDDRLREEVNADGKKRRGGNEEGGEEETGARVI